MTDLMYNNDNILCNFPTCLRKNIEELCLKSQIGLSSVSLQDISILSNRYNGDNAVLNYHFIIKVPYAGKRLKWEVIFDPEDFSFAPDFDFNDDQFLNNPDFETIANNVPALAEWNLKNPKALSAVLNEFLALYKNNQIEKLLQENIYSRYAEEYQVLVTEENGVEADDVEISIDISSIYFLVSLRIDCSSLPEYIQPIENDNLNIWYNPGEDYAHLKISILKLDGTRSNVMLQLSPRLEQVLGNSKNLVLPDYKKEVPLVEYVSLVLKMIDNRIGIVADHFKMKKVYITNLIAACNRSIIEYDTDMYNKAVFMYTLNDYDCLVTVNIGAKFPQEKPSIQLSSIYCQEGKHCNENLDRYPYNSSLQPDDNIESLLEYLPDAISQFKVHKH